MTASLTLTKTPTAPAAKSDGVVVTITGLASNDATAYSTAIYPTEPELRYRLDFVAPSSQTQYDLSTEVFSVDADGTRATLPTIFPVAGTWTVNLVNTATGVTAATTTLVIS